VNVAELPRLHGQDRSIHGHPIREIGKDTHPVQEALIQRNFLSRTCG
jgi:hypothetical protein